MDPASGGAAVGAPGGVSRRVRKNDPDSGGSFGFPGVLGELFGRLFGTYLDAFWQCKAGLIMRSIFECVLVVFGSP